jgi:hypothetical protein
MFLVFLNYFNILIKIKYKKNSINIYFNIKYYIKNKHNFKQAAKTNARVQAMTVPLQNIS